MAFLRFRNLGQYGVVTETADTDLPVNAWTDALNVRFDAGKIAKIGGWQPVSKTSCIGDQTPYTVAKAPLSSGQYFYGTNKFIYSTFPNIDFNPSDPTSAPEYRYNVTPRDSAGVPIPAYDVQTDLPATIKVKNYAVDVDKRWDTTICAERTVFNNSQYEPIGQQNGADYKAPFVRLSGWGVPIPPISGGTAVNVTWRAGVIHAYKNFLVALNMTEGTASDPVTTQNISNRVRWSDVAYDNQLPLNWYDNTADTEFQGGFNDLMDATSPILDGSPLRDYFMIYTNTETYLMNYTGGTFIFSFEKVFNDSGVLAKGCIAEYEGQHVVVTQDDVIVHDGSQKQSIIQGVVRDRLLAEISSTNALATRVFTNPVRKEVWVCYNYSPNPDPSVWSLNRAAIYSFINKTWTFTELPDIYDAAMGELVDPITPVAWEALANPVDDIWTNQTYPWAISSVSLGNNRLYAASAQHCLMLLDLGDTHNDITFADPVSAPTTFTVTPTDVVRYVERTGIDMDEDVEEIGRVKTWRCVYPQLHGEGSYDFTLGAKTVTGTPYILRSPTTLTYGVHYKADCFITGRYHSIKISSTGAVDWGLSSFDVDYVVQGRR